MSLHPETDSLSILIEDSYDAFMNSIIKESKTGEVCLNHNKNLPDQAGHPTNLQVHPWQHIVGSN